MNPSQNIGDLVDRLRDIPTLSVVVTRIMELVNNPKTSSAQIADALKKDSVLSAKILRLVNSSFYSLSTEVTDIHKALGFLGYNTLSALVLSTSVFSAFEMAEAPFFNVVGFWRHSLATALSAEMLAKRVKHPRPEEAFVCGLLHDIGKIALFKVAKDELRQVMEYIRKEGKSFLDAELALGLPGHTILGERLAERWQLPVVIRKSIRYHHRDIETMESLYPAMKPTIMITSLANIMAKRLELGDSGDFEKPEYLKNYLKSLHIDENVLREIEERMPDEMDRASAFLSAST